MLITQPLNKKIHKRDEFDCGVSELNSYLKTQATQLIKDNYSKTFVCPTENEGLIGYYSLSSMSFDKKELPEPLSVKLRAYPVPSVLIGRLAVDKKFQGQGHGESLLLDAFERIFNSDIGVHMIIVDAKNEEVVRFYKKYGFVSFKDQRLKLFLSMKDATNLILDNS